MYWVPASTYFYKHVLMQQELNMSAKLFLGISAVVAVAYGIGFLFAPEALMSAYGVAINPSAIMEVRFWGATLTGLGIMYWLVRGSADLTALRGILYGFSIAIASARLCSDLFAI